MAGALLRPPSHAVSNSTPLGSVVAWPPDLTFGHVGQWFWRLSSIRDARLQPGTPMTGAGPQPGTPMQHGDCRGHLCGCYRERWCKEACVFTGCMNGVYLTEKLQCLPWV